MKFLIDKVLQFSLLDGASGRFSLVPLDVIVLLLPVGEIYTLHAQQRVLQYLVDEELHTLRLQPDDIQCTLSSRREVAPLGT